MTTTDSVRWSLSTYSSPRLTLLDSDPGAPHALLLLGGLTDTLGSLPYTDALAHALSPLGISIVLPQLSSGLGGYGVSSVEADAREVAAAVFALRTRTQHAKAAIFLLGHSTGCQDIIAYLRCGAQSRGEECTIQGAILQGPCSDRLDWELSNADDPSALETLENATELVRKGQGSTLLPRVAMPTPRPAHTRTQGPAALQGVGEPRGTHEDAVREPPFTAYRYWSLFAKGGDEDYFSLDVDEEQIGTMWKEALAGLGKGWKGEGSVQGTPQLMALCGEEDQYTHEPHTSAQQVATWTRLAASTSSAKFSAHVLPGANHKVWDASAQAVLVSHIVTLLSSILGIASPAPAAAAAPTAAEAPSHPASFDAIVELISTGRADAIPGIRQIPLVINEAAPSTSELRRPPKPWERKLEESGEAEDVREARREYEETLA